jgi:hypothetical protein
MLPKEYIDRQRVYEEEIADLGSTRKDGRVEVILFINWRIFLFSFF